MTTPPTLESWVASRRPPVPEGFRAWMKPGNPAVQVSLEALVEEARSALRRAESPTDRPRGGAFDLLVADGYATWACEAALDEADPVTSLRRVVDALLE